MNEGEQLEQAIAALEAQRALLGDAVVEPMIAAAREKLAALVEAAEPERLWEGERRLVTIVFADISGFTALAETMDPESVRDLMNGCFNCLVPVIERFGGAVDKFIGDEIMALFGAPIAREHDPELALRAALGMLEELAAFNAARGTDLGLHIGVNTGLVIAGGIGSQGRQEYSVMGDAVNLAARLEEISQRGEILVGPDTHRLTAPLFEFAPLEPVSVKGKAEPVLVYRLLSAKAAPGKVRGIAGLDSPLVGRQAEFAVLREAVARLRAGVGGIVTLVGEAGLGKSRLVAEIRREATQALPLQWVEGRCLSYGSSISYLLWLDVLRGLLGVTPEDPPPAVRDVLRERVQALCPESAATLYPCLGRLLSLPLEAEAERAVQGLEGEALKTEMFRAVEMLIESAARQQPLVVVCEDLHWADPTSLELLERLLAVTDRVALFLVCIFRPEMEHGCWGIKETAAQRYAHRHCDLRLAPLSAAESETLVSNLLRVEDLPRELRQRILHRAEGNPFFVEEIIRALIDDGAIVRDPSSGCWQATREVAAIPIPETLQGVLMARIDRLQEETRHVLQLAAVIGRIFLYRVLAEIAQEERALDDHLLLLQQQEMIRERARLPELEYIFKHHLTQEAAYNGLLKKERRVFHRRVAEALERLLPDRVDEQVGLLAYHWEQAEEADKAVEYLLRAGDQARLVYAHAEAVDYYRRALAFLGEDRQAARVWLKLGLTYQISFDYPHARQAFEQGFALWQKMPEEAPETLPAAPHALRIASTMLETLDPAMTVEASTVNVINNLFSGLVEESADMGILPGIARDWEVSEGGRTYTFHLRPDVRWSDGMPVTAGDFEFAWKRALDPATGSPAASMLYDVRGARAFHQRQLPGPEHVGVRALDDLTLVVELEGPTAYFLQLLTGVPTYPVPRHVVERYGSAWADAEHIVTNGPFSVENLQQGQVLRLCRNPHYYGQRSGNVQQVELVLIKRAFEGMDLYEAGRIDGWIVFRLLPAQRERILQRYAGEYLSIPLPFTTYLVFDTTRPPFDDVRVRRAFAMALDREAICDSYSGSVSPATGGLISPGMPGHSPGIGLPYDPAQARQLLAEAGYPGGLGFPRVDLLFGGGNEEADCCIWRCVEETLNVEVRWEVVDWGVYFDRLARDPGHVHTMGWTADYLDPDTFLRVGIAHSYLRWHNAAYEELIEQACQVLDQQERLALYREADRILIEEAAIVPLGYMRGHMLTKPWVTQAPVSVIKALLWKDVVIEPHE